MRKFKTLLLGIVISCVTSTTFGESSPVQLDTKHLYAGLLVIVKVNGLPVFIMNRRAEEIAALRAAHAGNHAKINGCVKCDPILRSVSPDYLVVWCYNPAAGCQLIYAASTATDWVGHPVNGHGGFVDKCSGTEYDLSGRKLSGPDSSPDELAIPTYTIQKGVISVFSSSPSERQRAVVSGTKNSQP